MAVQDKIETRELVIKDDEGRCRIRLSAVNSDPSIEMFDSDGTQRLRIYFNTMYGDNSECPTIELYDAEGIWLACLGVQVTSEPLACC